MKTWDYFEMAARMACFKQDRRAFLLGAVGRRYDGALISACNGPTDHPNRTAHAEYRASRKMDRGSILYVVRLLRSNKSLAIAKPCKSCQKALIARGVSKVYYSINEREFGCMEFSKSFGIRIVEHNL